MTYKEFVRKATEHLTSLYSMKESKALALRVLSHYLGCNEYDYLVTPDTIIPKTDRAKMEKALEELALYRPIQYVLGYEDFEGLRLKVDESVLIPRPETASLVRLIKEQWKKEKYSELKILDACTGSGAIAYALADYFPKAQVSALDISDAALITARAQKHYIEKEQKRVISNAPNIFKCDILDEIPDLQELDILVSNPPYVCDSERVMMKENVLDYEPETALFVPDSDPLRFYRALAQCASEVLAMGGKAYFEINEAFGESTVELFESYGFSDVTMLQDLNSKNRMIYFTKWF